MVGTMTYYELWNTKTSNAVGDFDTEAEALAVVREAIQRHGRGYADMLMLGCEDDAGESRAIAAGQELAELALHTGTHSSRHAQAVPA
jgi:hypothetical protein